MELPKLPHGAVLLSTDEAVWAIVSGDHLHAADGHILADVIIIDGLRSGLIAAIRLASHELAIVRMGV